LSSRLASANEQASRDLEAAAQIQKAFLPAPPADVAGFRFALAFEPGGRLAGGHLNAFPVGDRHLGLYVLDVHGGGVAAALLAATAGHLLAHAAGGGTADVVPPAEVVARVSARLSAEATAGHVVTLLYAVLG